MINPSKHLIAFINYIALVPLVYFIPQWLHPFLSVDKFIQVSIDVAIIVVIISYMVMPLTMKFFDKKNNKISTNHKLNL